jgi:hypothetical protein
VGDGGRWWAMVGDGGRWREGTREDGNGGSSRFSYVIRAALKRQRDKQA